MGQITQRNRGGTCLNLRQNDKEKKVPKNGIFEKTPTFGYQSQTLKPLWINTSNKSLDAKRPIIGGRLCITPYKDGA